VAKAAVDAGVAFASAYPGTPSTEILETLAKRAPHIYAEWSPNEKVALEVGMGAAFGGARVLVTMKHVGVNVAADPLFTMSYTGTRGGLVLVSADDPGMHSSQNEQDNRQYAPFAKIPMLEPANSQEAYDFARLGWALSEEFDTPVLLRMTTRVCHGKSIVVVREAERLERSYAFVREPQKFVMVPAWAKKRHAFVEERTKRLRTWSEGAKINRIEGEEDKFPANSRETTRAADGTTNAEPAEAGTTSCGPAEAGTTKVRPAKAGTTYGEIGVVASGVAGEYVREVLPGVPVLQLGMTHPLPDERIRAFAVRFRRVAVVEEQEPYLENHLRRLGIAVEAKPEAMRQGELTPDLVREIFGIAHPPVDSTENVPPRPPVLCPGCSHRAVYTVLKKLKLTVTGDIGCYTLGALPPLSSLDTCVCMGAGLGHAMGLSKVLSDEDRKKVVAVIGDSTFLHSGIAPLIDMVYNNGDCTVLILDNGTTAMTGRQDHPATGKTLMGGVAPMLDIEALVRAVGVRHLTVVNPWDLAASEQAVSEAMAFDGPAVVIQRGPCMLIRRKEKILPFHVDPAKCKGCGQCARSGCPAVGMLQAGEYRIDPERCRACNLCAQLCKFGAIAQPGG
jgi:indolepyruvate ferredoxin oxidoreductase alpha subunit